MRLKTLTAATLIGCAGYSLQAIPVLPLGAGGSAEFALGPNGMASSNFDEGTFQLGFVFRNHTWTLGDSVRVTFGAASKVYTFDDPGFVYEQHNRFFDRFLPAEEPQYAEFVAAFNALDNLRFEVLTGQVDLVTFYLSLAARPPRQDNVDLNSGETATVINYVPSPLPDAAGCGSMLGLAFVALAGCRRVVA